MPPGKNGLHGFLFERFGDEVNENRFDNGFPGGFNTQRLAGLTGKTEQGVDSMVPSEGEGSILSREREIVTVTYLVAVIPLFGILIAAVVILAYKEKSRTVVFHAKQAIAAQAFFLLVFVVICLFGLFALLVGVLSPLLERILLIFDKVVLYAAFIAYVAWCFYFAWLSLEGRDVELPVLGARLRGRSE